MTVTYLSSLSSLVHRSTAVSLAHSRWSISYCVCVHERLKVGMLRFITSLAWPSLLQIDVFQVARGKGWMRCEMARNRIVASQGRPVRLSCILSRYHHHRCLVEWLTGRLYRGIPPTCRSQLQVALGFESDTPHSDLAQGSYSVD
ncbi:hypothetical protein GY45DRAFT_695409 [Cubamyces sp. BRFM 1775]|nr:hypothetical protein GY45DRAFT_695409 [Cubamyces sp. BRFM 1775]